MIDLDECDRRDGFTNETAPLLVRDVRWLTYYLTVTQAFQPLAPEQVNYFPPRRDQNWIGKSTDPADPFWERPI